MKLIYSTNSLETARALVAEIEAAGIPAHLAGENVASTPGSGVRAVRDSLGVWVIDESKIADALEIMRRLDLLVPQSRHSNIQLPFWAKIILAAAVAAIVVAVTLGAR